MVLMCSYLSLRESHAVDVLVNARMCSGDVHKGEHKALLVQS